MGMKHKAKKMAKDAMYLGGAGIGLGVMSGISSSAAPAIGTLSSGLGTAGSLVMVGHGIGMLSDAIPRKKRGGFL